MDIRATSDDIRGILSAATKGDIEYLDQVPDHKLKAARCNSGKVAGSYYVDKTLIGALKGIECKMITLLTKNLLPHFLICPFYELHQVVRLYIGQRVQIKLKRCPI